MRSGTVKQQVVDTLCIKDSGHIVHCEPHKQIDGAVLRTGGEDAAFPHWQEAQDKDFDTPSALPPCGWTTGKGKVVQVPSAAALRKVNELFSTPGTMGNQTQILRCHLD